MAVTSQLPARKSMMCTEESAMAVMYLRLIVTPSGLSASTNESISSNITVQNGREDELQSPLMVPMTNPKLEQMPRPHRTAEVEAGES
jgi:hypothetical protein